MGNLGKNISLIVLSDTIYAMIVSLSSLTCLSVPWCGVVWCGVVWCGMCSIPFRFVVPSSLSCLVLCRPILHCLILYGALQCVVYWCIVSSSAMLCCTTKCCVVQSVLLRAVLNCVVQYSAVQLYVVVLLFCAVLC